jgi:hypothetical protein
MIKFTQGLFISACLLMTLQADDKNMYIGTNIGMTSFNSQYIVEDSSTFRFNNGTTGLEKNVYIGYKKYNKNLFYGLEFEYSFNNLNIIMWESSGNSDSSEDGSFSMYKKNAYIVSFLLGKELSNEINIFSKIGFGKRKIKINSTGDINILTKKESMKIIIPTIGIEYKYTNNFSFVTQYKYEYYPDCINLELEESSMDTSKFDNISSQTLTFGISYLF